MIGTNKFGGMSLVFEADQRTTMPAGIIMCIYFAMIASYDNDRIFLCFIYKIITGFRDLRGSAGEKPVFFPDMFPLKVEDGRIGVEWLFKAPSCLVSFQQVLCICCIHIAEAFV